MVYEYEPPVPKTAKGYYYYRDKNFAITLPQFPFSKRGGEEGEEKVPLYHDSLWGHRKGNPPIPVTSSREICFSELQCLRNRDYCTSNTAFAISLRD
jgi:hypothetical protein